MRAEAVRPRRRWPWVLFAAAVIGAIVVAAVFYYSSRTGAGNAVAQSPSPTPTSNSHPTGETKQPDGCWGGSVLDGRLVLAASKGTGHTTTGAIEAATVFMHFIEQYPYPVPADSDAVQHQAVSPTSKTTDLTAFFASKPNLSAGMVANATPYYLSTVNGVYHVESSTSSEVSVSIGAHVVVNGAASPTLETSLTVDVRWEDGKWKYVSSKGQRTTDDLFGIGQPFSGGC